MNKSFTNAVNIDVTDSFLDGNHIQVIISEMLTIAREALVELSGSGICVATFALSETKIHISSRQPISSENLRNIKTKIAENLYQISHDLNSLTHLPCTINGQPEKKYNLDSSKCKFQQQFVIPLFIQNLSIGLLYVGNFDASIDLEKSRIVKQLSKYFARALRHLWSLNTRLKEKYELMVSRVIDGVILCDSSKKVQFMNTSAKQILELQIEKDWVGEPLVNLQKKYLNDYLNQALKDGIFEINKVVKCSENNTKLIGVHLELIKNFRNIEIGWMIILRDVTKNWQSDQMRSALTIASHEIKTPLNSILGSIDLLLEKDFGDLNSKQQHCLNIVKDDINRLDRLLTDILDLSRFDEGIQFLDRRKEIALGLMVNKCIESFKLFANSKNIQIKNKIPKSLPTFKGHRDRLQQVLANLVENSIKYTLPGGKVTIGAELIDSNLKFWVKDTGVGIPSTQIEFIFKKFNQLDNYPEDGKRGYGLGLSIAEEIIKAMGGEIWLESEVGVGSTFFVSLPL